MARFLLLFVLVTASGCPVPTTVGGPCDPFGSGDFPCRQQIYFPTGVSIDPDGDVLYVTNGNADLRYAGGTISAIDLPRLECIVAYARQGFSGSVPGCDDALLDIPTRCLTDGRTQRRIAPSQSDHDGCRLNALDPRVIECDECPFLASTVRVGNFAGQLVVQKRRSVVPPFPIVEASCPSGSMRVGVDPRTQQTLCQAVAPTGYTRRLWANVRGDPSITFVNIVKDNRGVTLVCDDPNNPDEDNVPSACASQRVTVRDFHADTPGITEAVELPPEPFGLQLNQCDTGDPQVPECLPGQQPFAQLAITHLSGGQVTLLDANTFAPTTLLDLPQPAERVVLDVRGGFFPADAQGRRGAFAIAPRLRGDRTSPWYLTSRNTPIVAAFEVSDDGRIAPGLGFTIAGAISANATDLRGLLFEPDGNRAYLLTNGPAALVTVDTRIDPQTSLPRNRVLEAVALCPDVSHIALGHFPGPGRGSRVYAVCFATGQVQVVDPELGLVLDTIAVGRGAFDIALNFGAGLPEPARRRAYVTNYLDSTLSVIDLERGSPTENRSIALIGLTPTTVTR